MRRYRLMLMLALAALLAACGGPETQTARTSHYTVTLRVEGAGASERTATIGVTDAQGRPAAVDAVVVAPVMRDMGMAAPEITATPDGPGRYTARGVGLTMVGAWDVEVRLSAGGVDETAAFVVRVT